MITSICGAPCEADNFFASCETAPFPGGSLLFGVGYKLLDLMGPMNSNETLNNFRGFMAIDIFGHEMALTLLHNRHVGMT